MAQIVLLHCSDVHFCEVPYNSNFSTVPLLSSQNGHDFLLCQGLPLAMDDIRILSGLPDEEDLRIVLSGDLTATGGDDEFVVGHTFFRSHYRLCREQRASELIGFDARPAADPDHLPLRLVPGNHDHWWGSALMWGNNPNIRGTHFRNTPWLLPWRCGELELELAGIDSCAGTDPRRRNLRQIGRLDLTPGGEFESLRKMLFDSDQRGLPGGIQARVRAVVVHHSLAYAGGLTGALELEAASKQALLELAEEFQIAAFLTGHTHDFFFDPPFPTLPQGQAVVYELRSASTLQGPHHRQDPEPPGFWAHKIWLDNGKPKWTSWRYIWNGANRFEPRDRQTPCVQFDPP